jgi:pimeloyl-ACP methyl ester carboxylesterase
VRRSLLLALVLPLLAGSASAGGPPAFPLRVTGLGPVTLRPRLTGSQPCAEAPGFTCSNLTVPLDHQGRAKGELGLQVAVQDGPAPRGVLVFLTGGPGQPGAPFAARVAGRLGGAIAGYRLVLIDQRGTGPNALQCPMLQAQMGSSDLAPPTKAAVTACARAIGSKRQFFGTDQTVQDLDLLRRALGVAKLNLDGVSYGSFVAERYALRYPTRVARLVLDSVVPHAGINGLSVENAHAAGRVLRALCYEQKCVGDPAEQLAFVVRTSSIDTRLLDALVTLSVFDPTYPGVIDALYAASHGRRAPLEQLVRRFAPDPNTPAEALSQGLHASALCADNPMPWGGPDTPTARRLPALLNAAVRVPRPAIWPFTQAVASANGIVRTCLYWPPEPAPANGKGQARGLVPFRGKLPAVPTLLLAGDRDLSTPLEWARQEARLAPRGTLIVVPKAGHSVQMRAVDEYGRLALRAFLHVGLRTTSASSPPVDGCVTGALRAKAIEFHATDGVPLRGVLLGSGRNGIVLSHEFRANLCNWLPFAQQLAARGYRVLAYDSRSSRPTEGHLDHDVLGAERELVRRGVKRVIVGGASAGGTAALTAAASIPPSVLAGVVVLSSPSQFGSMDAERAARKVTAPSFFGVGNRDTAFVDEMRKLSAASAAKRKQLFVVSSSGHGTELLETSWAPASFRTKLLAFIAAAFRGQ